MRLVVRDSRQEHAVHLPENGIGAVKPGAQLEGAAQQVDLRALVIDPLQARWARKRGDCTLTHRRGAAALMSLSPGRRCAVVRRTANEGPRQLARPSVPSLDIERRILLLRKLAWRSTRDTDRADTGSADAILMDAASRGGYAATTCTYQSLYALVTLASIHRWCCMRARPVWTRPARWPSNLASANADRTGHVLDH
jgi:hypothetical protein